MILSLSIYAALAMLAVAILLNLWRLAIGPDDTDRVLALDTLFINTIALLVVLGIHFDTTVYFESALVLALIGFIGTAAFCKYQLRGDLIE
ncbi:K+/H+ antiporter subunit F [Thiococcus pfennigii]|jgi:multicomponent K+:H+ antiporter subunit F|uniref:K+/H+ antiporter subunit F n=1 Tax=Thiococcus pfennigii TaxID=1057 RepID=UPI001906EA37|nr:K+/H+ antiporter subunit F [Thiococcus pfennigii]MBK1701136.1 K+/H+ antiporter subunit F [Thiococcus pfennigii]MBK1730804.1 K+/H+ antiporter subunit F [Thiococcus pfennigii]